MAHKIREFDIQQGIEQAWHGLTDVKEDLNLKDNFLRTWDVEPEFLHNAAGEQVRIWDDYANEGEGAFTDLAILRTTDTRHYLGKAFNPESYIPLTNSAFLDLIEKSLAGTGHKIASLGSVMNRGRIFVSVSLESLKAFSVGEREFEAYLNFGSSHDMSCAFYAVTSNICTVCNNTFTMNLMHKGKLVNARIKHTKNSQDELKNLPELIDAAIGVQREFAEAFASLDSEKANSTRAERIFTGFLNPDSIESLEKKMGERKSTQLISTRSINQINRLSELFISGKGNRGQSLADVASAITDYYSHESSGGDDKTKQFISSEFGSGLRKKQEFWSIIRDEKKRDQTEAHGEKILAQLS